MAVEKKDAPANQAAAEPIVENEDDLARDLPVSVPRSMRRLARDLPERDSVQKAYKQQMLASDPQAEHKAKVKIVEASPDAEETPSGYALKKTAGISHDTERGEAYAREKSARRWGYAPVEA